MTAAAKSAWRARVRARRSGLQLPEAGAALAQAGLVWLETLDPAGTASDGGTSGAPPGPPARGTGQERAVCAYISRGSEPPTGPLLESLTTAGFAVYVAVCEPDFLLSWTRWTPGTAMALSPFAPVMEPVGPRLPFDKLPPVHAILIPALAVDTSGVRLGQGGGYYDRFLAGLTTGAPAGSHLPTGGELRALPLAAVLHEGEVFPAGSLPHDALDAPVGYALTPAGHRRLDRT